MYFNCIDDDNIGVPFGRKLVLWIGFGAVTERQIKEFLTGVDTRLTIDGVSVNAAGRYWGKPFLNATTGLWTSVWTYDTGRVVEPGTPRFAVEFEEVATKTVTDGFDTWSPGDVVVSTSGPCFVEGFQP